MNRWAVGCKYECPIPRKVKITQRSRQEGTIRTINKYGLSRDIPEDVALEIRRRCGFGCVVCGSAIYQYEHIDPPFKSARHHDPDKMALLCPTHHDLVTKGFLAKDTVKCRLANPKCLRTGFSFGPLDLGSTAPAIIVGSVEFVNFRNLIKVEGEPLLSVSPPELPGLPFRVDGLLRDAQGNLIFELRKNEWRTYSTNWDAKVVGNRIIVRQAPRVFALVLRAEPPNRLILEKMNATHRGVNFRCTEQDGLSAFIGSSKIYAMKFHNFSLVGNGGDAIHLRLAQRNQAPWESNSR
jgi:hypothetical protein